jgi:CRISPR-associated protein Csx10
MELLSDLCPASGDGFAGFVDTDVCFDDLGLPYIPAKRLKGCLRECGLDILSVDGRYSEIFALLFGEAGKLTPGALNVGNGNLENYADILRNLGSSERSEIAEVYTSIRSRTKMDNGKAAKGTLRTARVLNKGQVYAFPVSLADNGCEFLAMCVTSLRHMGLNRSRGLGEVRCSLEDADAQPGALFPIRKIGERHVLSYTLALLAPVISAERTGKPQATEDYIFGSAILGAFAARYIEKAGLKHEDAYKDANFRRIFLDGGVKFTAAMPCADGLTYYPAPAVLRTDKLRSRLFDESLTVYDDSRDGGDAPPICRRLGGFVLTNADGTVQTFSPAKTAFPHHARPADRGIAHATEEAGGFYMYEALSAGQTFAGSAVGSAEDLRALADLFADSDVLRIGRSRTAQYGKVKIAPADAAAPCNALTLRTGDVFRLVAVTPIILEDEKGLNKTDIRLVCDSLGPDCKLVRSVCSETLVSGYYGKWLLPRRQERALAEGSTMVFKYDGAGRALDLAFIGRRTGEGFGQIRLEAVPNPTAFSLAAGSGDASKRSAAVSPEVKALRAEKSAVADGIAYGETCFAAAPPNATLTRVLTALKQAASFDEFVRLLGEIRQAEQKIAAFAFVTGENKGYFKVAAKRLEVSAIASLLAQSGYEYPAYQTYLHAAAQRVKQQRRSHAENKKGGESV